MQEICALVVNAARARYFTLEYPTDPALEGGPDLVEVDDQANPSATLAPREQFSNLRGRHRSPGGGPEHRYDDHRDKHQEELTQRFAKALIDTTAALVLKQRPDKLVIAASPDMLGRLRPLLEEDTRIATPLVECAKDLSGLSPKEIHAALVEYGCAPQRREPTHTRNGRRRS